MNPCPTPIRIAIADDHHFFRTGFRYALEQRYGDVIQFVGEAPNGADLLQCVEYTRPDVVITDIRMPTLNGIEATLAIHQRFPDTGVIALSMFDDTSSILQMLRAGASGYLVKSSEQEEVIDAIRTVSSGHHYYCSTISDKLYNAAGSSRVQSQRKKSIEFSVQEKKVMQLICRQQSSKEIAGHMQLAVRTVENYRHHIQEKIGARNVVGIALFAVMNGIVQYSELL